MDAGLWQRLKPHYEAAMDLPASERGAYAARLAQQDEELAVELAALVESDGTGASFLEPLVLLPRPLPEPGTRIGPYQIRRLLGRGGMGAVFEAIRADDQFHQRVALKLVERGLAPTLMDWFRRERQILATLEHPNIARLLDGGSTAEGHPYLVMEYIEGQPIDAYCRAHDLDVPARLRLFREVCAAVHHAHRNLIVHRDLKPANILVSSEGVPKLLDFGIAKLLSPQTFPGRTDTGPLTVAGSQPMTPEYASPEQVRGENITVATDIYSLGVILYELLAGCRPYPPGLPVERAICESTPPPPSAAGIRWRRQLQGDLDNIVRMALRKEPERRYSSVEQFSEDLRRCLEDLPVLARPDTFRYRAVKFTRRHKAGVAAAVLAAVSLTGGLVAAMWQARIASAERAVAEEQKRAAETQRQYAEAQRRQAIEAQSRAEAAARAAQSQHALAERRFNDVRSLANSFLFEFHDAIQKLPGSTPARKLVVAKALEYLDRLSREAASPDLERELAAAYLRVGDVQGNPYLGNLGDTAGALESFRKALAIRDRALRRQPRSGRARYELAHALERVSAIREITGDLKGAAADLDQAAKLGEEAVRQEPGNKDALAALTQTLWRRANVLSQRGDFAAAIEAGERAFRNCAQMSDDRCAANALMRTGQALRRGRKAAEALAHFEQARDRLERLLAADPGDAAIRRMLAASHAFLGDVFRDLDRVEDMIAHYRHAASVSRELSAADPKNLQALYDLVVHNGRLNYPLFRKGDYAGALEVVRQSREVLERMAALEPANLLTRRELAIAHSSAGAILVQAGRAEESGDEFRQSAGILEELVQKDSANLGFKVDLAFALANLGDIAGLNRQTAEARAYLERSRDLVEEVKRGGGSLGTHADLHEQVLDRLAKLDGSGTARR